MDINERLRELGIYDSVDFFNKKRPQSAQDAVCIWKIWKIQAPEINAIIILKLNNTVLNASKRCRQNNKL